MSLGNSASVSVVRVSEHPARRVTVRKNVERERLSAGLSGRAFAEKDEVTQLVPSSRVHKAGAGSDHRPVLGEQKMSMLLNSSC